MFVYYNPNPQGNKVGDCVIRAITKALDKTWDEVYIGIALKGLELGDMPSSNAVWGAYLKSQGYERHIIPNECPNCYTVEDFCNDHPEGVYLLALSSHVVAVINGNWYDIWDSGGEVVIYYWEAKRKEE